MLFVGLSRLSNDVVLHMMKPVFWQLCGETLPLQYTPFATLSVQQQCRHVARCRG